MSIIVPGREELEEWCLRRDRIMKWAAKQNCPQCKSEQVQLIDYGSNYYLRCRMCKKEFLHVDEARGM